MKIRSIVISFKTEVGIRDGTEASLFLILNVGGIDVCYQELGNLRPKEPSKFADRSYANLFIVDLPSEKEIDVDAGAYLRLAIGTRAGWTCNYADSWAPRIVFVWAVDNDGRVTPLAFERNANIQLSKTKVSPVSFPIPRTSRISRKGRVSSILVIVLTDDGTWDPVSVAIESNSGNELLSVALDDRDQWDTTTGVTNLYLVPIKPEDRFPLSAIYRGRVRFRIVNRGMDRWKPRFVYLFAISDSGQDGNGVAEILSVPEWPFGGLSFDKKEGRDEICIDIATGKMIGR